MELKGGHGGNRVGEGSRRLIGEGNGERGLTPPRIRIPDGSYIHIFYLIRKEGLGLDRGSQGLGSSWDEETQSSNLTVGPGEAAPRPEPGGKYSSIFKARV